MYTDLMIDLETLGTSPGSVIKQIGLCSFDLVPASYVTIASHNIHIDIDSCTAHGMTVDASTIQYWLGESAEARQSMRNPGMSLPAAMKSLVQWVQEHHENKEASSLLRVWAHGTVFDIGMLEFASKKTGIKLPWTYQRVRDTRLLAEMYPDVPRPAPRVAHDAREDAEAQALWVSDMWGQHLAQKAVAPQP